MSKTAAFPKILAIGDRQILDLFETEVEVTEKIDGSQFSFGKIDGVVITRSKGREFDEPDKLFKPVWEYVHSIEDRLPEGIWFYGETLCSPRHSTLAYDRVPKNHFVLFGVYRADENYFAEYNWIKYWADVLEVDPVPLIFQGKMEQLDIIKLVKDRVSYLGGQNIEGVVVKAYKPWMFLGRIPLSVMSGKYVTEEFKEVHTKDWSKLNTGKGKFEVLKSNYRSEARWNKAIQHLQDDGQLTGTPKDIGGLIKEVQRDITDEEYSNIKEQLWNLFGKDILSESTVGLAQWYKEKLIKGEVNEEI